MTQSRAGRSADAQVAPRLDSIDEVQSVLAAQRYIADRGLATAVFLALKRHKPLLLEGEPGVGKTEIARALAVGAERGVDPAPVLRGHRPVHGGL